MTMRRGAAIHRAACILGTDEPRAAENTMMTWEMK
jgi:hypothetical protein